MNILELHRTQNAKKSLQKEVYDIVLKKCHRRIVMINENQKVNCFFDIPSYIIGYPLYDLNKCAQHILYSLKKNGLEVTYFFPNYLYISWALETKPPSIAKTNYLLPDFKPLLSSTIQKNKKGKISINL